MSCTSLSCSAVRQCDRSCTVDFTTRRLAGKDGTSAAACGAALRDCERCLRDSDLVDLRPLRQMQRYSAAGCEDWDPAAALPGFEEAEKRTAQRRPKPQAEPMTDFEEIVHLLDLKRCPKCGKDWSKRKAADDHTTALLKEDSAESRYSQNRPFVVTFKGKKYCSPYAELIAKAVNLCPFCRDQVPAGRPLVRGPKEQDRKGGGKV
mmetsp:Transcript_103054/g.274002  ORF Transcript_103054/g.274002 Transcript_103054/m.274002 type:complete len:206 (-) Transcript_103054:130-747(-)